MNPTFAINGGLAGPDLGKTKYIMNPIIKYKIKANSIFLIDIFIHKRDSVIF